MSRLDRYVGRIALGAFAASMLFFVFVSALMHLINNVGRYADRAAAENIGGLDMAGRLLLFYAQQVPVLVTTLTPFAVVTAAMFTVARLQHANEVVPMLFVGRSITRVMRPVLLLGVLAAGGMAACWEWVVPVVGPALASADAFMRAGSDEQRFLVHEVHGEEDQYFYVKSYQPRTRTLTDVSLIVQGALAADVTMLQAKRATWDDDRRDWRLEGGEVAKPGLAPGDARHIDYEPREWLGRPDLTPGLLLQQSRDTIEPELLGYSELWEMAAARPNRGEIRLALHRHFAYPLSCLLLLLLTLPMAIYYERGSRIDRLLGAIGLCAAYLLLDLTCQSLGQRATADGHYLMHPVVAAWTPTIVFGSLGFVLFGSTKT